MLYTVCFLDAFDWTLIHSPDRLNLTTKNGSAKLRPLAFANNFFNSDQLRNVITGMIQESLAPTQASLEVITEELPSLKDKITALKTTVREVLDEKDNKAPENSPMLDVAAASAPTVTPASVTVDAPAAAAFTPSRQANSTSEAV